VELAFPIGFQSVANKHALDACFLGISLGCRLRGCRLFSRLDVRFCEPRIVIGTITIKADFDGRL